MSDMMAMDRRAMLGRMALLLGAAAVPADAFAKPALGGKRFLDATRMGLLTAVADTMIPQTDTPGAFAAKVPAKFDALLINWAAPQRRTELVGALSEIDALAMAQEKMGFTALTPEKRNALLTAHDFASLKNVPRKEKLTGMAAMMAGPAVANPAYAKLRELIILLFFYSEEALTSVLTYEHSPGGWTPSIKVTPETRNTGGLGMF
jgi:gluconate 2-dehydrogenase gamma chain